MAEANSMFRGGLAASEEVGRGQSDEAMREEEQQEMMLKTRESQIMLQVVGHN